MTNTIAAQTITHPSVRQALARRGMVAALTMARVILTADTLWHALRAEDEAGGGYSEQAYRDAEDDRIAAEEAYYGALRLAEAGL
jgi:hypothetical protein